jgi:hypothetical protein
MRAHEFDKARRGIGLLRTSAGWHDVKLAVHDFRAIITETIPVIDLHESILASRKSPGTIYEKRG